MHRSSVAAIILAVSGEQCLAGDAVEQGRTIVEAHCARCHAAGPEGASPLPAAPPFRMLGQRYAIPDLEEALAEGIVTAHPAMPEFAFQPAEIDAIIAYMQSVQE
jgi:cytochrome c